MSPFILCSHWPTFRAAAAYFVKAASAFYTAKYFAKFRLAIFIFTSSFLHELSAFAARALHARSRLSRAQIKNPLPDVKAITRDVYALSILMRTFHSGIGKTRFENKINSHVEVELMVKF